MRERSERTGTIAYQPALDGVRALAVVAVLLFHAEVRGFSGGYLGVSVFFTLSGYLITSLLLAEHASTGTINKSGFYARRVRRLLPASLTCLGATVAISMVSDVFDSVANLRREVLGALLQVSNWVFLAGEGSYQQLFQQAGGGRSPVEHFWSLSIEEQFYWVWPPAMALILGRWASKRGRTAVLTLVTLVFVVAAPVTAAVFGPDAAYWATPARVGEILIGALLALVLSGRRVPQPAAWLAPLALLALAICVVTFPAAGGPAYDGWLPAVAVGSAMLVFGLQVDSPLRRALSTRPLVWLGGISYGIYVYHWPIYVIADEGRTGLDGWRLLAFRLACTLVIAELSYRLLEQPIRRARGARRRTTLLGGAVATTAVAAAAVLVVPSALGEYWRVNDATVAAAAIHVDGSPLTPLTTEPPQSSSTSTSLAPTTIAVTAAPAALVAPTQPPVTTTTVAPTTTTTTTTTTTELPLPALSRPVRIIVAGDSTARAAAAGLLSWAADNPTLAQVEVVGAPGCGFVRGGERREGGFKQPPAECDHWLDQELPERVSATQPDVVMMMVTTWDVLDHRWDDGDGLTPLDPAYAAHIDTDYRAVTEEVLGLGAAAVAWVAPPIPNVWWDDKGTGQEDTARHAVVRGVMDELAYEHPDTVHVIDLGAWLDQAGLSDDHTVRPDGVHLDPGAARTVADDFLGERLVRIAVG